LADTVHVAGKVLRDAYRDIYAKLGETISTDRVLVLLTGVARIRYNVIGAVPNPGEYIRDDIISLFQALNTAGGLMTAASKEVTIRRNEQDHVYDLNRYIMHGDLSQNPLILSEDVIIVKYAENYVKIYIADEIEFIELSEGLYGVRDAISQLSRKNRRLNFQSFTVERDGAFYEVDGYFALRPDDSLYIRTHDVVVYVTGCVVMPGRFVYNGNTSPHYYISQAGGPTPFGSRKRILLLNDEGKYVKYEGQPIKPGDTIYVPESGRSVLAAYIGPIGSVVSILATIFILAQ
jgi:protein involved in polysaccharide export with SLBB domain